MTEALLGFFEALPMACSLKDAAGGFRYMSDPTRRMFLPHGAVDLPNSTYDVFPPEVAQEILAADRKVIESGQVVRFPVWLPDNAGGRRLLAMIKFPVPVHAEVLIGAVAIDITAFTSAAWDASTYKQILDAISDMILVKGPKSKLLWANQAFLTAYGMSNADLQGIIDAPFVEPDLSQQYAKDDQQVFSTGKTVDITEEPMMWADGKARLVHTVKSPLFGKDGTVEMAVAVLRDITDRKRLEVELRQAQKLESLGRLAAGMAHEINTPIQFVGDQRQFAQDAFDDVLGILAQYQDLARKVDAGTATATDTAAIREAERAIDLGYIQDGLAASFASMADGVKRVSQLVLALKEFGHPDSGTKQAGDINAAVRRTVIVATNEYRYVAEVELDLGPLPPVLCSIGELQQVILNLIVNAAHAIADLGSTERGTIRIGTRVEGEFVVISIADTGCGMSPDVQAKVFDPFFTTKAIGRGTGQGLSIARMIIEKHHGSLAFESHVGTGTTFFVRIPRAGA
ncbi:MAG: PAS domain-containing protein [Myxococcales bacterium]|nr:PAS domain-containing protein [Myxococcales bacterium]